jgi:hypothetical protein
MFVLGANEEIEDLEVSWLGDLYVLVVDKNIPVSKLIKYDPIRGNTQLLHTINERIHDFAFYEFLDTGPRQFLELGPQYFVFGSHDGHVLKWVPATNTETMMVEGFRFPVTTLAFGKPWHGAGPSSLFVMTGADNPTVAEFFEIGPTDQYGFLEPQTRVSLLPEALRGRGDVAPFLRVEGMPQAGQTRTFVLRWADPDGFGLGGSGGTLAIMAGGLTRYPGFWYLPGLYTPLSEFPVMVMNCFAGDPTGPSTVPGAGVGRMNLTFPPVMYGDLVMQAAVLDINPNSSLGNTWVLSNAVRVIF